MLSALCPALQLFCHVQSASKSCARNLTNPAMHWKNPTIYHFVTEMCTHVHVSVTKWCTVGYGTGAPRDWDWEWDWDKFIQHKMTLYRCMISDIHDSSYVLFSTNLISHTSLHVGRPLLRPFLVAYQICATGLFAGLVRWLCFEVIGGLYLSAWGLGVRFNMYFLLHKYWIGT